MPPAPLSGVVVVDLTHALAGPYCTRILRDLGARVIKIERGPKRKDRINDHFANAGKESICLDLKGSSADCRVLDGLLSRADVLVENFRPGVADRLGFGWGAVHARHPRLVMASVSGFGQEGPYARHAAVDTIIQGMSGLMSVTGAAPGATPLRMGASVSDMATGLYAAIGVQAALLQRHADGRGRRVDIAMLDASVALMGVQLGQLTASGKPPGPLGNAHPSGAPFDVFECADGKRVAIAAHTPAWFRGLCEAIGRPELAEDPLFANVKLRRKNYSALRPELQLGLRDRPRDEWVRVLRQLRMPCGPVNDMADIAQDPQVRLRNMIVPTADGRYRVPGNPVKITGVADSAERPAARDIDADGAILRSFALDTTPAERSTLAMRGTPLLAASGARVESLSERELTYVAPMDRNINRGGTGFGGAIALLLTAAGAALTSNHCRAVGIKNAGAVVKESSIKYRRPARGQTLRVTARFADAASLAPFAAALRRDGKATVRVVAELRGDEPGADEGAAAASYDAVYHASIRPPASARARGKPVPKSRL